MTVGKRRVSAVTILIGVVMLLVPALAWMQYQWLGQLSTAERERMQRTLRTAAAQFATEFDTELSRTLISLQVDGATIRGENGAGYAQRYSAWVNSVTDPRLVRDVWLVDTTPGTPLANVTTNERPTPVAADRLRLRKWNPQSLTFENTSWPDDLVALRDSLAARFTGFSVQRGRIVVTDAPGAHRETWFASSLGDDETLIAPVTLFEAPADRRGPPKISILGFTIVRLDPAVIRDSLLASLTTRHFHGGDAEVDYRVAVVRRDNPEQVVWESEPGIAKLIAASPDVTQGFMGPRPEHMFTFARALRGGETPPGPPPPPPPLGSERTEMVFKALPGSKPADPNATNDIIVSMVERETERRGGGRVITRSAQLGGFGAKWTLMAKHRAGSLEAAVTAVRQRNLWISTSTLVLLTVVIGLIAVSARRAQALARQQMEFVAAVSHELRTPVSVIGAAAGNLADGVVGDLQRVRKYGETIQGEARRLGETVERVLQLAGIAAGRAAAAQAPVRPADLVHGSIDACRMEIDRAAVNVEVAVADDLPMVVGDVTALRSALQNLISNAVKYGGAARWIRVSARAAAGPRLPGSSQVLFTVEDRGPGVDANERTHIFEPFYRGRDAVSQQIQGSGLGLHLVMRIVEAHGGKVSVASEPGKGSAFTLALPAASDHPLTEHESLDLAGQATPSR